MITDRCKNRPDSLPGSVNDRPQNIEVLMGANAFHSADSV